MYTRKIPLRFCFVDRDHEEFVGQQLVRINKDEKFLAPIKFDTGNCFLKQKNIQI